MTWIQILHKAVYISLHANTLKRGINLSVLNLKIYLLSHPTHGGDVAEYIHLILFTNPSARAGYDTRSIFKWSLTGLNSEFSFS